MNHLKSTFFLCMTILLLHAPLWSQNAMHKWSIGAGYTVTNMEGLLNKKNLKPGNYTGGANLFIGRYLSPTFNVRLQGMYGNVYYPLVTNYPNVVEGVFRQQNFFDASFLMEYKFNNNYLFKEDAIVQPYLFIGFGTNTMNNDWNTYFPWGGGVKFKVTNWMAINLETTYKVNLDNSYNYLQHQAGLIFSLGKTKKAPVDNFSLEKINNDLKDLAVITTDSDKDGIDDTNDECPYVAGVKEMNGCPDGDADGISDSRDKCPNEFGLTENNGCPAKVVDTDGDGISDDKDRCPAEQGTISNQGCPVVSNPEKKQDNIQPSENILELFYPTSGYELSDLQKKSLDGFIDYIVAHPVNKIIIKGHTSNTGPDQLNVDLSMNRALKVSNYLASKGISLRLISVQGWGSYNQKYDNATPEGALKNQRVEVVLE